MKNDVEREGRKTKELDNHSKSINSKYKRKN